jgi:hypothetical protein
MTTKSPFYISQDFISQKTCDYIVDASNFIEPDTDPYGKPICANRPLDPHCEQLLFNRLQEIMPEIESHFNIEHRGVERMSITWMPEDNADGTEVRCGNAAYVRQKWLKNKDRDLTCHLFLSTFNDAANEGFDPDFEVFGGKLQFPQYDFSFNPQAGTLIVHPSGPHFLHAYSNAMAGDLFYVTFHISSQMPHIYNPKDFPGNYKSWF